jgi:NAD(P)H-nitrite reductase large subunit
LILATGSYSFIPDIKGIKKKGVFGFRTFKDASFAHGIPAKTSLPKALEDTT